MRFATLAFATGAVAQLTVLQPIITKIVGDVGTLDTAITGYSSGDASGVLSAGKGLLDDINSGVASAKASTDLSQNDALSLTTPIQGLQSATENVIKDLTAKKCAFVTAGKAGDVLTNLQDQLTASQALADAITSKVPQALQSVAAQLSSGIATALQGGITSFKDTSSCPAAPGGGGSSSAAPSSGATSSASAAPSSTGSTAPSASAKPTASTPASNSTVSSAKPSTYTGAAVAGAVHNVASYGGAAVIAALVGAAL